MNDPQGAVGTVAGRAVPRTHGRGPRDPRGDPAPGAPRHLRRLRIAVDFDGVLFDHLPHLLRAFREVLGIDLEEEGLRHWDLTAYRAVKARGLTQADLRKALDLVEQDHALHRLPPRDAMAREAMARWRGAGHEVHVVTARTPVSREAVEMFLRHHGLPHDHLRMGAADKTGYDVLIDDAPTNALAAARTGSLALLMDQPYNRHLSGRDNPWRVHDWRDVRTRLASVTGVAA